jgi:hypothetical protein
MDRRWAGAIVVQAVPLDEPRKLHPEGRFAHADTGFPMPESAGPFARVAVTRFDAAGRHLAAGYDALVGDEPPLPVVSTVFVCPAPPGTDLDAARPDRPRAHEGDRRAHREPRPAGDRPGRGEA